MKRDSSLRRFTHPGQGEPKPVRCYAQRSPAVARNYEEVRCGSVVRKNCQDVTAYAVGSLQGHFGESPNVGWPRPEPQNPKVLEPARACGKRSQRTWLEREP